MLETVQSEMYKILLLCETRWLSCELIINGISEQWDVLTLYFQSESSKDKADSADDIKESCRYKT